MRTLTSLVLLPVLAGCAFSPDIRNTPLTDEAIGSQATTYQFDAWLAAHPKLPARAVIVTMSGGGTRAAAFSDAVIHELSAVKAPCTLDEMKGGNGSWKCDLAKNIILVSGISGGSMTAARLVINGPSGLSDYVTSENSTPVPINPYEQSLLRRDLASDAVQGFLNPRYWTDRSDNLSRLLSGADVEGTTTYGDLILKWSSDFSPFLILGATDILSGRSFVFDQSHFDDLCSDLSSFRIADSVAAASDLPYVFSDVELLNYRSQGYCQHSSPKLEAETSALEQNRATPYTDLPAATEARYRLFYRSSGPKDERRASDDPVEVRRIRYLHLVDGGLADNLGIRPVVALMSGRSLNRPALTNLQELHLRGVEDIVFVEINAKSDKPSPRYKTSGSTSFLELIQLTSFGPIDQVTELSSTFAYDTMRLMVGSCVESTGKPSPNADCKDIPSELYPIRFDFDLLPTATVDDLQFQESLKSIETTQQLSTPTLSALRRAASILADREPCLRDLGRVISANGRDRAVMANAPELCRTARVILEATAHNPE